MNCCSLFLFAHQAEMMDRLAYSAFHRELLATKVILATIGLYRKCQESVEKLEVHPPDKKLPRLADLKGISPKCTGTMSSVDFVRALRDE